MIEKSPGEGVICKAVDTEGWVEVTWDVGGRHKYRMGCDNKFDLSLAANQKPTSSVTLPV
jgi:hypothetical protein